MLKVALRRERAVPVLAVTFASAVSMMLLVGRIVWTHRMGYALLAWNLFLAWLPLLFALLACEKYEQGSGRSRGFYVLAAFWLLFFPNAPYIFTDLFHLTGRFYEHFWLDMTLILLFALTGLVLGFLSLYLMQSVVARMFGRVTSWLFVVGVACLSSFGIYLGRFLRFNSWDIIFKPVELSQGISASLTDSLTRPAPFAFQALFATFLFISYLMLYALTHLKPTEPVMIKKPVTVPLNARPAWNESELDEPVAADETPEPSVRG
jgi:uncharacterized membrane protein